MMKIVLEQLPKAIRWSKIVMWFTGIITAFLIIGTLFAIFQEPVAGIFLLIITALVGVQFWMVRNYKNACQEALDSEQAADVEQACRAQTTLVKFYGIFTLLAIILGFIGMFAIAIPAYQDYVARAQAMQIRN